MMFSEVLKSCRTLLYDRRQVKNRGIDLTRPSVCHYNAFESMYKHHHMWRAFHAPFSTFTDRSSNRILRNLGDTINVSLVNRITSPQGFCRVFSQSELEAAFASGYNYEPGLPHGMVNPDQSESRIHRVEGTSITVGGGLFFHGGSPYTKHMIPGQMRLCMRHVWRHLYAGTRFTPIIEALPYVTLNQRSHRRLIRLGAPSFITELFYAFYNESRWPQWWYELRRLVSDFAMPDSTELFAQYVAKVIWDALPKGEAFMKDWRSDSVNGMINHIWENESFDLMPILADALEDMSCSNVELLQHLRDPAAEFTLGSWIFRCCGKLK